MPSNQEYHYAAYVITGALYSLYAPSLHLQRRSARERGSR